MFNSNKNFLELLAYTKDNNQKKNLIKIITKPQFNLLKNFTKKLLNGDISLKKIQVRILQRKKTFLRKLCQGKIKIKDLPRECIIVCYIVRLGLEHHEICSKISTRSYRKVGKNRRQYSRKTSYSENSSSSSSEEEYISCEESYSSSGECESEKSERIGEECTSQNKSDVSFSESGEEEPGN